MNYLLTKWRNVEPALQNVVYVCFEKSISKIVWHHRNEPLQRTESHNRTPCFSYYRSELRIYCFRFLCSLFVSVSLPLSWDCFLFILFSCAYRVGKRKVVQTQRYDVRVLGMLCFMRSSLKGSYRLVIYTYVERIRIYAFRTKYNPHTRTQF